MENKHSNNHSPEDLAFELISKGKSAEETCQVLNTLARTMERLHSVHNDEVK